MAHDAPPLVGPAIGSLGWSQRGARRLRLFAQGRTQKPLLPSPVPMNISPPGSTAGADEGPGGVAIAGMRARPFAAFLTCSALGSTIRANGACRDGGGLATRNAVWVDAGTAMANRPAAATMAPMVLFI